MTQAHTDAAPPASASVRPDPKKIIVPRKHGDVLIEPSLAVLQQALQNPSSMVADTPFAGQSFQTLRRAARQNFLHAATSWAQKTNAPPPPSPSGALDKLWILTGHQLEFYHAGVWAKVLAANELANRCAPTGGKRGAIAFDLLVDHDIVDHLGFDIPAPDARRPQATWAPHEIHWTRHPINWSPASSIPADGLHAPTLSAFEKWDADLAALPQSHTDSLAFFLAALKPSSEFTHPYAQWLSQARSQFEQALDIHVHHVPTSLICAGNAWQTFVRTWIDNAETWTTIYNQHLAAYRIRAGIKNPQHPMPDLARGADTFELPFWIYKVGQPRQRLIIRHSPTGIAVLHDTIEIDATSALDGTSGLVIRPRALALTMFVRLFLADVFIHGIGGALYDQITDGILDQLFGIIPAYACVSAAWLLPLGQPLEDADDISNLKSHRHHITHNPQLIIDPFTAVKPEVAQMIRDRRTLIERIGESLSTSRGNTDARQERREWFQRLHSLNKRLHQQFPRALAVLDQQLKDALQAREQKKVLLWREYFFGLHTMESLRKLIAVIHGSPQR